MRPWLCLLSCSAIAFALPDIALAYDDRAFQEGSGQSGVEFRTFITLIFHASLFLLAGWTIFCLAREWMDGGLSQRELLVNTVRMVGLVVLLGFFVR